MPAPREPDAPKRRRRGDELSRAILRSTLELVAEDGFEALTFERVAARARAGKASLYKRWSTTEELVMSALEAGSVLMNRDAEQCLDGTGTLRDQVIAFHQGLADVLETPMGRATLPLMLCQGTHPEFFEQIQKAFIDPRYRRLRGIIAEAVEEGEAHSPALRVHVVAAGLRIMAAQWVWQGRPLTTEQVEEMVDDVLLPAIVGGADPDPAG